MNFNDWIEQADMPGQNAAGEWVDFETGFAYKDCSAPKAPSKALIKSALRKEKEKAIRTRKKELDKLIADYRSRPWETLSPEQKTEVKAMTQERYTLLATKVTFEMKKIVGNTYDYKDWIKRMGGRWNGDEKAWYVPSDNYDEVQNTVSARL